VAKEGSTLMARKIADVVVRRLGVTFDNLMDYSFTAQLETKLDHIAEGDMEFKQVLDEFYADFVQRLDRAEKGDMPKAETVPTSLVCDKCGRPRVLKAAHTGMFLSCSGWGTAGTKDRCRSTIGLNPLPIVRATDGPPIVPHRCPRCGSPMDRYSVEGVGTMHVCGLFPDCSGHEIEAGPTAPIMDGLKVECHKCASEMQLTAGRFGRYFKCACGATRKCQEDGTAAAPAAEPIPMPEIRCTKVNDFFVLRDTRRGLFLSASKWPLHKETRPLYLDELMPHGPALPERHRYLLSGPLHDDQGNRTTVSFSPQQGQCLRSRRDGKLTTWCAMYDSEAVEWRPVELPRKRKKGEKVAHSGDDAMETLTPQLVGSPDEDSDATTMETPRAKAGKTVPGPTPKAKAKPKAMANPKARPKPKAKAKTTTKAKAKTVAKPKAKAKPKSRPPALST
jgi:DNA topoisomerase-1